MEKIGTLAEKVGRWLQTEIEQNGEKIIVKKQRTLEVLAENCQFICTLKN